MHNSTALLKKCGIAIVATLVLFVASQVMHYGNVVLVLWFGALLFFSVLRIVLLYVVGPRMHQLFARWQAQYYRRGEEKEK